MFSCFPAAPITPGGTNLSPLLIVCLLVSSVLLRSTVASGADDCPCSVEFKFERAFESPSAGLARRVELTTDGVSDRGIGMTMGELPSELDFGDRRFSGELVGEACDEDGEGSGVGRFGESSSNGERGEGDPWPAVSTCPLSFAIRWRQPRSLKSHARMASTWRLIPFAMS